MKKKDHSGAQRVSGMMAFTELASTSPETTRRFLEEAFDWKFEAIETPTGQYLQYRNPTGTTLGIRPAKQMEVPCSTNYVRVESLAEAERKIRNIGGEIVLPRTDIPDMGSFFWFKIPAGPVMACWQDAPKDKEAGE